MTDSLEAMAFNSKMHINDIYSCRSVSIMEVKVIIIILQFINMMEYC